MGAHKVEIWAGPGRAVIHIDGEEVHGVRDYTLTHEAGGAPQLTLDLATYDVSTVAAAAAHVPSDTAATLIALGWTPPEGQEVDPDEDEEVPDAAAGQ